MGGCDGARNVHAVARPGVHGHELSIALRGVRGGQEAYKDNQSGDLKDGSCQEPDLEVFDGLELERQVFCEQVNLEGGW